VVAPMVNNYVDRVTATDLLNILSRTAEDFEAVDWLRQSRWSSDVIFTSFLLK